MINEESTINSSSESFSPLQLLIRIWTNPRKTLRYIIHHNPKQYVIILAIIGGFFNSLDRAISKNMGDSMSLLSIYLISILVGPIIGILGLYLFGALLKWTGTWLGGIGNTDEIRAAYAWGLVPMLTVQTILLIPELALFGRDIFTSDMLRIGYSSALTTFLYLFSFIDIIAIIWSFIVYLKGLGEVQGFSAWKALLNSFLSVLIVFIFFLLISIVFRIL